MATITESDYDEMRAGTRQRDREKYRESGLSQTQWEDWLQGLETSYVGFSPQMKLDADAAAGTTVATDVARTMFATWQDWKAEQ